MRFEAGDFQTGAALRGRVLESLLTHAGSGRELAVGDRVGPYQVDAEIGRGGMGVVYRASRSDGEYRQQVALKWMPAWRASDEVELLFRRERQSLADLAHPHIARLLDGGSDAGQPWFVMELVDGRPLDRHCAESGLSLRQRVVLLRQVCAAVAHAHGRGLLHRDIKPGNVLVDAEGEVKLLDFGIARLVGQEDSSGLAAFTPGFASPEQQRGEAPTVASDVYQLGRLSAAVLAAGPADSVPPRVPKDLTAIINRACAEAPEARYPTAQSLADDLQRYLVLRPVQARGGSPAYRLQRLLQRHPLSSAASVLAVLGALAMAAWFTDRLREQRDIAMAQAAVASSTLAFVREDLLAAADPAALPGRELTVREALDRAVPAVAVRFAGLPVEQSAVRLTLAELYQALGRDEAALDQARLAISLPLPPSAEDLHQRARLLALDSLLTLDRLDEVSAYLAQWAPPPSSEWAPAFDLRAGKLVRRRGDFSAAEALLAQIQASADQRLGPGSSTARVARSERAFVLQMLGRQDEAHDLLGEALDEAVGRLGARHPESLVAAHALGVLDRHRGKFAEAESRLREVLAQRIDVLGGEHPDTLFSRNELATVLQESKRYDEAEPLFREVLNARTRLYGESHIATRNAMSNLGLLYSLWGRLAEASALYERTLAVEVPLMGEAHPDTLALMHNIAGLYRKQERLAEALAMHRRVLAAAGPALGAGSWQVGMFRAGYALSLRASGDWESAEREMQGAVDAIETALGSDHARSVRARQLLAELRADRPAAPLLAQPAASPLR